MKTVGYVVVIGIVAIVFLVLTGNMNSPKVDLSLTQQGRANVSSGIQKARAGLADGLDTAARKVQEPNRK